MLTHSYEWDDSQHPTLSSFSFSSPFHLCFLRAADWKLDAPDWTGRMRVTARGKVAYVKLEDKISGERGEGKKKG